MNNKTIGKFAAFALAIFMTIAVGGAAAASAQDKTAEFGGPDSGGDHQIIGVWQTTVTPVNCTTGLPAAPDFRGLITFNMGGTLAEIAAGSTAATRSPGHGIWRRANGRGEFAFKLIFLRFNAAGVLVGRQRVTQTARLSPDGATMSGGGSVEVLDLDGNVLGGGCSTATAVRFDW